MILVGYVCIFFLLKWFALKCRYTDIFFHIYFCWKCYERFLVKYLLLKCVCVILFFEVLCLNM